MRHPLSILLLALPAALCGEDWSMRVQDAAIPFVWPANAPRPDDVTMRTLWFRPVTADDPQDTFAALEAFHATRLEWSYLRSLEPPGRFEAESGDARDPGHGALRERERQLIARVKAMGRFFGGASNASSGTDVVWHGPRDATKRHTLVDIDGQPLVAGHMRHWPAPQSPGCANNPHYLEGHVRYILDYIEAGAEGMQRDEPSANESYAASGIGCFCDYCMEGFRAYLHRYHRDTPGSLGITDLRGWCYRDHVRQLGLAQDRNCGFDWSDPATMRRVVGADPLSRLFADFQQRAQADFFKVVRERVNAHFGGAFPYSCNNTSFQRYDPELYHGFDFHMSELMLRSANAPHLYERSTEARRRGRIQVFGSPKTMGEEHDPRFLVALRRKVIATSYAVGGLCQVPWDLFEQTRDGLGRYFGRPADYADLYALVRASGQLLHRYTDAGAFGPGIPPDDRHAGCAPLLPDPSAGGLFAFVRAVPRDYAAPVVIHLVDWSDQPAPVSIRIRPGAFFPGKPLRVTLRAPAPHDAGMHAAAEAAAQALRTDGTRMGSAQRQAYEPLVRSTALSCREEDGLLRIDLPVLDPWGILIIEPLD